MPDLTHARVAIIGLGPIGLLFGHAMRDRGVSHITGIDLVDRSGQAADFGIDHFESVIGRNWSTDEPNRDAFDLVVEAVGHQVGTMQDAINVVAPGGTVPTLATPTIGTIRSTSGA